MCTKKCSTEGACPFAFTEESERAQNYGCLPAPIDIVEMRVKHGKTWACHAAHSKPCKGALKFMRERQIECKVIDTDLVTDEDDWSSYVSDDFYKSEEWQGAK